MRSRTYAFMPWITATTATRNPTDTMIPSSVKKERSLWLHAVWSAWRIASERGMGLELNGKRETGNGKRWVDTHVSRFPLPVSRLFVPQRLHRIQSRRLVGGIQPESDPGERGRGEGREHGPQRHVRGDRRQAGAANATTPPASMPTAPPTSVRVEASTRNCHWMARRVAPSALRTPISRVR